MNPDTSAQALFDHLREGNVMSPTCPSRGVLQHLTSRWGVLVMALLATDTFRFAALRRRIGGVSERMLAQTLQQLEADGMVVRRDHGTVPPHVDYSLTPLGHEAARHLVALVAWIEGNIAAIEGARITIGAGRSVPASA